MKHLVATAMFLVTSVFFVHAQNPSVSPEGYSTRQIHLYVSPQGNNGWPGSQNQPKASLKGARDAVRQLKSKGGLGPVHVKFANGHYPLMEPVTFTPQDNGTEANPVIYEAMQGTRPVFSGGRKITGFRPGDNGLWVAEVPGATSGQWVHVTIDFTLKPEPGKTFNVTVAQGRNKTQKSFSFVHDEFQILQNILIMADGNEHAVMYLDNIKFEMKN